MQQNAAEVGGKAERPMEAFSYPVAPEPPASSWAAWGITTVKENGVAQTPAAAGGGEPQAVMDHRGCEKRLAEEVRSSFEAGRERGVQEGRAAEREAQGAAAIAKDDARRAEAARLVERFTEERYRYFEAVEPEVVKLALAIAARILRREAQMDPLLLTGAVRVALGQLSDSTEVRLRVPAAELGLWEETMAHLPRLAVKPTVLAGEGMLLGECVIETALGSVDLGVRTQLGEIERGFFDRAGQRPVDLERAVQGPGEAEV